MLGVIRGISGEVLLRKIIAARNPARLDRPDYVGPERKIDREPAETAEAGEKTAV